MSLKVIAIFMISLIITIPMYVSNAMAYGVADPVVYGNEGVPGYIADSDNMTIRLDANVFTGSVYENITAGMVRLNGVSYDANSGFPFEECTDADRDMTYSCTITEDTRDWVLDHPTHRFTLYLFKADGGYYDERSVSVNFDTINPAIRSFTISPTIAREGNITWTFTAFDLDDLGTGCSGLKKIEVYLDSTTSVYETVELNTDACERTETIIREAIPSVISEGDHTVYVKAYDMMNQESSMVSETFTVDYTPPMAAENSFGLVDSEDEDLNDMIIGVDSVSATATVNISEDAVVSTIYGDFSSFNKDSTIAGIGGCGSVLNGYRECRWDVDVVINKSGTYTASFNATDDIGNPYYTEFNYELTYDSDAPEVSSLTTEIIASDGTYFLRSSDNTITADIRDSGIGTDEDHIFLDLTGIGQGIMNPTNSSGNTYYWEDISALVSGTHTIEITTDTGDLLGNKINESYSLSVTVDNSGARVEDINITVGGGTDEVRDFMKTGDFLIITASVTDTSSITAYADFSDIIIDADNVSADSCYNTSSDGWGCAWTTQPIDQEGYISGSIKFYFRDYVGNTIMTTESVDVVEQLTEEQDYWNTEVTCSPEMLDREISSLLSQSVYCAVYLVRKESSAETLSIDLGDCTGDKVVGSDIFNNEEGSREPYIRIDVEQGQLDVDTIEADCALSIQSQTDQATTSVAEQENVSIEIKLYNLPVGELSESLEEKIDDAKDTANNQLLKIITMLNKIIQYAQMICNLLNALQNLTALWYSIKLIYGNTADTTMNLPYVGPLLKPELEAGKQAMCYNVETIRESSNEMFGQFMAICDFFSCKYSKKADDGTGQTTGKKGVLSGLGLNEMGLGDLGALGSTNKGVQKYQEYVKTLPLHSGVSLDVKDSLILSILPPPCLPGIVHNLNKYRQILCMYANCLETSADADYPIQACEDQKEYAVCKYFLGEFFKIMPFALFVDYLSGLLYQLFSDPLRMIVTLADMAMDCKTLCSKDVLTAEVASGYNICAYIRIIGMLGKTINLVMEIKDGNYFELREDYCSSMNEDDDDD